VVGKKWGEEDILTRKIKLGVLKANAGRGKMGHLERASWKRRSNSKVVWGLYGTYHTEVQNLDAKKVKRKTPVRPSDSERSQTTDTSGDGL